MSAITGSPQVNPSATMPDAVAPGHSHGRRLAIPAVLAAVSAAVVLSGCGGPSTPAPAPPPAPPAMHVEAHATWQNMDGSNYVLRRFCDITSGRSLYVGEASDGGAVAAGAAGCDTSPQSLTRMSGWQSTDGTYAYVAPFCDPSTGAIVYWNEVDDGGGPAVLGGGCAPKAPHPGTLRADGDWQNLDGQYLAVREFTDSGNGAIIYQAEADKGGGIGVAPAPAPGHAPGRIVQLTQWENVDGNNMSVAKFCDLGTGNLLYGTESLHGGSVAVDPGACQAVADGQFPPTAQHAPTRLTPAASWTNLDGDNYQAQEFCDQANGDRVITAEMADQGNVTVIPHGCGLGE